MSPLSLTAEQFVRLCSVLGVPPQEGGERRRIDRVETRCPIQVALAENGEVQPMTTSTLRDVSVKGATLCHPTAVKPGTHMVMFLGTENAPIRVVANVIHCKFFHDGTSLVGLEFIGFVDPSVRRKKSA